MGDIIVTPGSGSGPGDGRQYRSSAANARDWIGDELRWASGTFAKIAVTLLVTRAVTRFFKVPWPRLMEQAQDLSEFGRRKKPYSDSGGGSSSSGGASSYSSFGGSTSGSGARSTFSRKSEAPPFRPNNGEFSRFVKQVGGFGLSHHGHVYDGHLWPCPIASKQECKDCQWFEVSRSGTAYCVAVEKMRQILEGKDDGSDLYDLKERIQKL